MYKGRTSWFFTSHFPAVQRGLQESAFILLSSSICKGWQSSYVCLLVAHILCASVRYWVLYSVSPSDLRTFRVKSYLPCFPRKHEYRDLSGSWERLLEEIQRDASPCEPRVPCCKARQGKLPCSSAHLWSVALPGQACMPNTPGETTLWRKLATVSRLGQSDKVARWVQLREIQQGTTAANLTYSGAQVAANLISAFAQTPLFRFTKAMRETLKSGSGSGLWIPSAKPWTRSLPQTPEGI